MSRRKLTPRDVARDVAALNRAAPVGVRYPPGVGRAELRVPSKKQRPRQRKKNNEGDS